jgi:hypothetical protein
MHTQLVELGRKYEDISMDLEREKKAGRLTQGEAGEWKRCFQELQQSVVRTLLLSSCFINRPTKRGIGTQLVYFGIDRRRLRCVHGKNNR